MASILKFLRPQSDFGDRTTVIIGEAFDSACASLPGKGQPDIVREVIAKRIIEAAKKGERDPSCLRDIALAALGQESMAHKL